MIKAWIHTNAATAAAMTEVTDHTIREWSNGEFTAPMAYEADDFLRGTAMDTTIFGTVSDDCMKMGHIELPLPVANIQYIRGAKPVMARLLGLPLRDLEEVIHFSTYIVVDPGTTDLEYKSLLSMKDYAAGKEKYKDATIMIGAEAIEAIMKKENIPDREYMILHCIPVLPFCMRFAKGEEGQYYERPIHEVYNKIVGRVNRIQRLENLNAPAIILMNERRMLQEYVDNLIINGAYGYPLTDNNAVPYETFADFARVITATTKSNKNPVMPEDYETLDKNTYLPLMDRWCELMKVDGEDDEAESDTEWKVMDPEVVKETEEIEQKFYELLKPFINAVMDRNFPDYVDGFEEELMSCGIHAMEVMQPNQFWAKGVPEDGADKKSLEEYIFDGIYGQMRTFVNYRSAFVTRQEG